MQQPIVKGRTFSLNAVATAVSGAQEYVVVDILRANGKLLATLTLDWATAQQCLDPVVSEADTTQLMDAINVLSKPNADGAPP